MASRSMITGGKTMKDTKIFLYIFLTVAVCFHNCEVYIAEENDKDLFEIDENIIDIYSIMSLKREYTDGELFNTKGDKLIVRYVDKTFDSISSGFTQEWAEHWEFHDLSFNEWFADNSLWQPIKHGDLLPDIYSHSPHFPKTFHVRAVYGNLRGDPEPREIHPK